ncbi:MAG: substrate-binding domain-containing protein, partial [Propionibacteriaceae bacterium]|nr:substrate-binding domain-containing protein [Propionibacteriaceae bacterium]
MRHIGKLAGVVLASALALSACGTTADVTPPAQPGGTNTTADTGNNPAPAETGTFDPTDVAKPKDGKKLKIGAAFPILDQFLQNVADGMQKRADEAGVELVVVSAQERADLQLSQVENFVAQGMDGVIILPQDTEATQPMTDALVAAKIPLVYVNRRPANLDPSIPYAGSDSLVSGVLQMEE